MSDDKETRSVARNSLTLMRLRTDISKNSLWSKTWWARMAPYSPARIIKKMAHSLESGFFLRPAQALPSRPCTYHNLIAQLICAPQTVCGIDLMFINLIPDQCIVVLSPFIYTNQIIHLKSKAFACLSDSLQFNNCEKAWLWGLLICLSA